MMSGFTPQSFDVIHTAPAWMPEYERVVLYGLIVGFRPDRVLEIGTFQGGSTAVISAAMDDLGQGEIVCVDPDPRIAEETWRLVKHRATVIAKGSPEGLVDAAEVASGPFDVALIDGDHTFDGVTRDLEGSLPTLADEAHVLFHDAHFREVGEAIDEALARHPRELADGGLVSRGNTVDENGVRWGGLRLLRFHRQPGDFVDHGARAVPAPFVAPSLSARLAQGPAGAAAPRGPMRTALRRLILRTVRPLSAYQHDVNLDVLRSLESIASELENPVDHARARR